MRQINTRMKHENIIRSILAIIGILCFSFSKDFGWGFILGGIVFKENIRLRTKEGWVLLILTSGVMLLAIYLLLETSAVYGYIISTISYFLLREIITSFQKK
ncbi:MAG TPA: hypothetical protein H9808_06265 [Candidatus Atopostipes pullistercoris]|uniref:Uncharacterized protein n=1 Tax=Candidatus Atopostipes pullistercoris TaxID=2838467 RepID=A0A9D2G365_9LACT|nr:hypothetical protein [Candidatus Atopostipes pullistercoris]